ncbi:MAG: CoA protein activase [Actinobacteria bacterium]|nr:CoA protein activase [Actinomycetota bacterium]
MKITSPHMGNIYLLLGDLFKRFEVEYIPPPPTTNRTLQLGIRYSPEFACLPLKVTVGNFIEGIERGADTLVMAGGVGPCRFGYYAEVQKRIIGSLGYNFNMITVEPIGAGLVNFVKTFKKLAPKSSIKEIYKSIKTSFIKAQVFDFVEKKAFEARAFEIKKGATNVAVKHATEILNSAFTPTELGEAKAEAFRIMNAVEKKEEEDYLKIGIVGEFFILLEPFCNFDMCEWLGNRGVLVERSVYLTDWIGSSKENPVAGIGEEEIKKAAKPYLSHFVGGEGLPTIGNSVKFAQRGFDGVIQLFPFTCMPDTIAKSILPKISRDFDIPILSFVIDEQTAKAGVITRLEAFLDLIRARKNSRFKAKEKVVETVNC